ncbi:MAG: ribbon-helix-helix domain-containing protein [Candidatus Heimdallarchaeota archaeon]|nr:ribbon-helix-helix domain-containing protein [Candidatus Heimdallarchaeota archaeon]
MSEITVVQVRIDENESKELDALAKKLGISKSELIR